MPQRHSTNNIRRRTIKQNCFMEEITTIKRSRNVDIKQLYYYIPLFMAIMIYMCTLHCTTYVLLSYFNATLYSFRRLNAWYAKAYTKTYFTPKIRNMFIYLTIFHFLEIHWALIYLCKKHCNILCTYNISFSICTMISFIQVKSNLIMLLNSTHMILDKRN